MSSLDYEYQVLRNTVAARGTVRMVLVPLTFIAWAALGTLLLLFSQLPAATLLPLAVLAAGFEAIHALHIGVERIGRYLQVFYEETLNEEPSARARWETTAMAGSPALPGGGVDPLFAVLFSVAVAFNLCLAVVPGPTKVEAGVIGAVHLAVLLRIVRARVAAASQRPKDLEHYRSLLCQRDRQ